MMFWKNKKVLVTGADGFIASHLTEKLIDIGAKVSVIVRGTSKSGTNKNIFQNIGKNYVKKILHEKLNYVEVYANHIKNLNSINKKMTQ